VWEGRAGDRSPYPDFQANETFFVLPRELDTCEKGINQKFITVSRVLGRP
jgi:hypothetical protein